MVEYHVIEGQHGQLGRLDHAVIEVDDQGHAFLAFDGKRVVRADDLGSLLALLRLKPDEVEKVGSSTVSP